MKKTVAVLLSLICIVSALGGCKTNTGVNETPEAAATPSQSPQHDDAPDKSGALVLTPDMTHSQILQEIALHKYGEPVTSENPSGIFGSGEADFDGDGVNELALVATNEDFANEEYDFSCLVGFVRYKDNGITTQGYAPKYNYPLRIVGVLSNANGRDYLSVFSDYYVDDGHLTNGYRGLMSKISVYGYSDAEGTIAQLSEVFLKNPIGLNAELMKYTMTDTSTVHECYYRNRQAGGSVSCLYDSTEDATAALGTELYQQFGIPYIATKHFSTQELVSEFSNVNARVILSYCAVSDDVYECYDEAAVASGNVSYMDLREYGIGVSPEESEVYIPTPESTPEPTPDSSFVPDSVVNTTGNTTANIMNGGSMTQQGDSLYFLNYYYGVNICSGKTESTGYENLVLADAFYLNAVGDWLYFFSDDLHYLGDGVAMGIYKMRTDGSQLTQLRSGYCKALFVEGDRMYALIDFGTQYKWDLRVVVMDTDGNYITEYAGLSTEEFALYDGYIYCWISGRGICRIDMKNNEVTAVVKPNTSWFRVIDDKLFYIEESNNYHAVYMCDMNGENSQCVMPASVHWIKTGLLKNYRTLHCDGSYIYFYGTIDSYSDLDSKMYAYDLRTGEVTVLQIASGYSFSIAGEWLCSVDNNYSIAKRYKKSDLGLTQTEPYLNLKADGTDLTGVASAGTPSGETPVGETPPTHESQLIRNAQLIYDMVEQLGGATYLTARIKETAENRENLNRVYESVKFNEKVTSIEDFAIGTTLTIGSICAANARGAAAGAAAIKDAVIDSTQKLINEGLGAVIDAACLSADEFVYFMTQLSGTGTFSLFATKHMALNRDDMTEATAAEYIAAYYGARMDAQTQLMGYLYFEDKLPDGFAEKLETSLTTAFFSLVDFVAGEYANKGTKLAEAVSKRMAETLMQLVTGTSTSIYEVVSLMNNDIITRWGADMRVLQNALDKALEG